MKCKVCGGEITRLYDPALKFPDIMVDFNDDGTKEPLCRHCAVGILLLNHGSGEKVNA